MARPSRVLAVLLLCAGPAAGTPREDETRYCVPVKSFNLDPFRPINDGKELAYLMFLRSFISTVPDEPGVLSQYEFSPDGKRFQARVHDQAHWDDGSPVTAIEAALSIAQGLRHRPIGQRVRLAGGESLDAADWADRRHPGIRVLDARTFELRFESDIENVTGVVREALSTNSRHNRTWVVRLKRAADGRMGLATPLQVLGRHPLVYRDGRAGLLVGRHFVRLAAEAECAGADYGVYQAALAADMAGYETARSPRAQAISFQPNTLRADRAKRMAISSWIRSVFADAPEESGFAPVPAFFLPGESGYDPTAVWPSSAAVTWTGPLRIGVESPVLRQVLETAARKQGVKIELINLPVPDSAVDGLLLSSAIHDGRQVILQDVLKWQFVEELMSQAPRTRDALRLIAERSASTIPPDAKTLKGFEGDAREECALVPVARRYPTAFSKRTAPLRMVWLASGEPVFKPR